MNFLTAPQVTAIGSLLAGISPEAMPCAVSADMLASGRALVQQIPQVDPRTLQIMQAKFCPGEARTPAFFFRPAGWKDDPRRGSFGFLVPHFKPLSASRLLLDVADPQMVMPDDIGVLCAISEGGGREIISAAVFSGVAVTAYEFVRTKSHQHPTSGPLAELLGTGLAAERLYEILSTHIDADDLRVKLRYTPIERQLRRFRITTFGQIVQLSEKDLGKLLASKPVTGKRYKLFVQYLRELSGTVRLHPAMTAEELLGWRPGVSAPAAAGGSDFAALEATLNRNIEDIGMGRVQLVAFQRADLHILGIILQLSEEDIKRKVGRDNCEIFKSLLSIISAQTGRALHLGMSEREMNLWPRRHGRPGTGRISRPHDVR